MQKKNCPYCRENQDTMYMLKEDTSMEMEMDAWMKWMHEWNGCMNEMDAWMKLIFIIAFTFNSFFEKKWIENI